ncbi:MAG: glutaredoxin 3 [Alphaproteobacteria bacterium]
MAKITIYTTPICPYCIFAKKLLQQKGVAFEEINVAFDAALREEMVKRAGGRMTVPQIFVGATYVGGYDDLHALDKKGKLDLLLAAR